MQKIFESPKSSFLKAAASSFLNSSVSTLSGRYLIWPESPFSLKIPAPSDSVIVRNRSVFFNTAFSNHLNGAGDLRLKFSHVYMMILKSRPDKTLNKTTWKAVMLQGSLFTNTKSGAILRSSLNRPHRYILTEL